MVYYKYADRQIRRKGDGAVPSFTKKAIRESFLHLIAKKPLDKITVRDIVDDCGINRNTFYYYFQDIYAVLEDFYRDMIEALPAEKSLAETLSFFYSMTLDFAVERPHAARSLAFSLGFEGLERYCGNDLDGVILDCITRSTRSLPSLTALRMLRHAVIGLCLDAMRGEGKAENAVQELAAALAAFEQKTDKN